MTWFQIAYVVLLYFLLGEVCFRHISERGKNGDTFIGTIYREATSLRDLLFSLFAVVLYIVWPLTLIAVYFDLRQQRILAVTNELIQ